MDETAMMISLPPSCTCLDTFSILENDYNNQLILIYIMKYLIISLMVLFLWPSMLGTVLFEVRWMR